jgi:hypothetical protein
MPIHRKTMRSARDRKGVKPAKKVLIRAPFYPNILCFSSQFLPAPGRSTLNVPVRYVGFPLFKTNACHFQVLKLIETALFRHGPGAGRGAAVDGQDFPGFPGCSDNSADISADSARQYTFPAFSSES